MKYILLISTILFFSSCTQAEENKKPDFSKMTNEELIAHFMATKKKKDKLIVESKILDQKLEDTKKLNKTLDKLSNTLNIED